MVGVEGESCGKSDGGDQKEESRMHRVTEIRRRVDDTKDLQKMGKCVLNATHSLSRGRV